MDRLIHRPPSIGSLVKKIMDVNPELGTQDIIQLIREATRIRSDAPGDYASAEVVDETKALEIAKKLRKSSH